MLFFRILAYVFLSIASPLLAQTDEKPFAVVVYGQNNKDGYQKNLDSILNQNYGNFRLICICDGPTDGSDQLIEKYIEEKQKSFQVNLFKYREKRGKLASCCHAIFSCQEDEIIVEVDGLDWLAHPEVLSTLNQLYANPEVWMTYGQDLTYPDFQIGKRDPVSSSTVRNAAFSPTQFRSFYASLFHAIQKQDFLDEGNFFALEDAEPYLIPIIEMAGDHIAFIDEILYVTNQSSQPRKDRSVQEEKLKLIARGSYPKLLELPTLKAPKGTPHGQAYRQIADILHPTQEDYQLVHRYLLHGDRPHLERLADTWHSQRNIRILGDLPEQVPITGKFSMNVGEEKTENCIILYSSYNRNFPKGMTRLINCIKASRYKGDVLFRIGGWPDEEGGSLVLSHVPYAFKVSFFKEAERLGYKRILWMDSSIFPVADLNDIFKIIEEKGYLVLGNEPFTVGGFMHPHAAAYFGLTLAQTFFVPSCAACVLGIDLTKKIGKDLINEWYRAAHDPDAFFSARSDQNALSMILYQHQITDFVPISKVPHPEFNQPITEDSLFCLERGYTL